METWNSVIINTPTEPKQPVSGARSWIYPGWVAPAKWLFAPLDSMVLIITISERLPQAEARLKLSRQAGQIRAGRS